MPSPTHRGPSVAPRAWASPLSGGALDGFETARAAVAARRRQRQRPLDVSLQPARRQEGVVVTARRVEEALQEVPIPVTVVERQALDRRRRVQRQPAERARPDGAVLLVQPAQLVHQRSAALGAPFGLTNDGIEPGVGMYVDGVFYARPAAATLDFLDVERVEVLRGPQGTLFGKNTTAGAINVTGRRPSFTPEADLELVVRQLRSGAGARRGRRAASPDTLAGRAVVLRARGRDGTIYNTSHEHTNGLDNLGVRGQLLYRAVVEASRSPSSFDHTRQRPDGYAQVVAGVAPTLRPANRQWPADRRRPALHAAELRRLRPADRYRHRPAVQPGPRRRLAHRRLDDRPRPPHLGHRVALLELGPLERPRLHRPARDDHLGQAVEAAAVDAGSALDAATCSHGLQLVTGVFAFHQSIDSDPPLQEQGSAAARVLLAPTPRPLTPGLLDGYGSDQYSVRNFSAAVLRAGALDGRRAGSSCCRACASTTTRRTSTSTSRCTAACRRRTRRSSRCSSRFWPRRPTRRRRRHQRGPASSRSRSSSLRSRQRIRDLRHRLQVGRSEPERRCPPTRSAVRSSRRRQVKPEHVRHLEIGLKTQPFAGRHREPDRLRHRRPRLPDAGRELAGRRAARLSRERRQGSRARRRVRRDRVTIGRRLTPTARSPYTDGVYVSFPDAPPPLEDTGGPQVYDISGARAARHLALGLLGRRRLPPCRVCRSAASGELVRRARRELSVVASRRAPRPRAISWWTATRSSMCGSASTGARAGAPRSGRGTCSTRTTSSS